MKNNKGFTLIEMLVVIAIILALSVSAGLSADFSLRKAQKNEYKDRMWEVFKAADIYSELSDFRCANLTLGCEIRIIDLINKGLIDENITKKTIPIYEEDKKFTNDTILIVKKPDAVKNVILKCEGTCTAEACNISLETLNEYHKYDRWGKCS